MSGTNVSVSGHFVLGCLRSGIRLSTITAFWLLSSTIITAAPTCAKAIHDQDYLYVVQSHNKCLLEEQALAT